jgi:hypothetical protein
MFNTIPVRNASCNELRCDTVCCNNFGIKLVIHLNWANYWHKLPTNVCIVCFATRNIYIHTYRNVVRRYSPYDTIRNPTSKTQPGFSLSTLYIIEMQGSIGTMADCVVHSCWDRDVRRHWRHHYQHLLGRGHLYILLSMYNNYTTSPKRIVQNKLSFLL